ncbi:hypothetical protein [Streptomyces sp. NPDC002490]|uniref:hypothetical protein n=1 Tax=Streptomyces sp. NPDC002490 TaxID=3154416 RepID=UPI00332673C4
MNVHPLAAVLSAREVQEQWVRRSIALVPCGHAFAAIRMPTDLVHTAARTREPEQIRIYLTHTLHGPVLTDRTTHHHYALVPPNTPPIESHPNTRYLGTNTYLGLPRPDLTHPTTHHRCHWIIPPNGQQLCPPEAVSALLRRAVR